MGIENWVFVTGAPRSGTTFVGNVLSAPLQVDYIHEPFNPDCGIPGIQQRYLYLRPNSPTAKCYEPVIQSISSYHFTLRTGYYRNDKPWQKKIKTVIGSRGPFYLRLAKINCFHTAAIIKDPIGCLMTEYLSQTLKVKPLILIRHPIGFVASALRLDWDEELNLEHLLQQPELVEDYFADEYDFLKQERTDLLERAAALWRALNKVLLLQASYNPGWIIITHEALSQAPLETFQDLFGKCGLPWSNSIQKMILKTTNAKNSTEVSGGRVQQFSRNSADIFQLRREMLSAEQRRRIFEITSDVALKVYSEESFGL
jgi:hypothetical protein